MQVKFFAGLRERLGRAEAQVSLPQGASVSDAWQRAVPDEPMPANLLAARNMEYVDLSSSLADGDELAFFPPVTGGAA